MNADLRKLRSSAAKLSVVVLRWSYRFSFSVIQFNFPILRQDLTRLRSITDRDHLKVAHVEIFLRRVLHVSSRDGRNLLRIRVPVIRGQVVNLLRHDILQESRRLLERERKAANDRSLSIFQLLGRHSLIPQAIELIHELLHRAFSHVSANFRLRDPRTSEFRATKLAVRAVSVALVFTQVHEETSGWT